MARIADMEQDNANVRDQHREWQEQRRGNNQDANDWNAFREHLKGIGAPDPGEDEAEDFKSDGAASQAGSESTAARA